MSQKDDLLSLNDDNKQQQDPPTTNDKQDNPPPQDDGNNDLLNLKDLDIPEKFYDKETKEVNLKALVQSYKELERKLHEKPPEPKYEGIPDELKDQFKEFNLTDEQAKGVYEWLSAEIAPELAKEQARLEQVKLRNYWNIKDEEKYKERIRQIREWTKENLPEDVAVELASTAQGVIAIETLMKAELLKGKMKVGDDTAQTVTEDDLYAVIEHPNFKNDPELQRKARRIQELLERQEQKS